MRFIADLHVHSRYSRATSKEGDPENLFRWAGYKGVTVVGSGDFTHPAWRSELRDKLEPAEEGLYVLKPDLEAHILREDPILANLASNSLYMPTSPGRGHGAAPLVRFIITGEISTIYKKNGRTRKIHHLIILPGLDWADRLSARLEAIGNIHSDGRPILGLDSRHLLELTLEVCPEAIFIPAHIWTPHFSLFGSNSGFDTIEECYEDLVPYIAAVETGLSSDPPMNWMSSALDGFTLVSNSDAHSPKNLAREANLFDADLSYEGVRDALCAKKTAWAKGDSKREDSKDAEQDSNHFVGTVEFFPEEGRYHYDGHRQCHVRWHPRETQAQNGICPVCGRKVTIGVLNRVWQLADREEGIVPPAGRPYHRLIPLEELIASSLGIGVGSKLVDKQYFDVLSRIGPEISVLMDAPVEEIASVAGPLLAEAVRRVRAGNVDIEPGFDGEYGVIRVIKDEERGVLKGQSALFEIKGGEARPRRDRGNGLPKNELQEGAPLDYNRIQKDKSAVISNGPALSREQSRQRLSGREQGTDNLQEGLNDRQIEAVTCENGPVVVIAGPGTGKTMTLTHRIAYLINKRGIAPENITAVTFTNKAAEEMRARLNSLLNDPEIAGRVNCGTFHSICLDILRNLGMADLRVLDEEDSRMLLAEALRSTSRDPGDLMSAFTSGDGKAGGRQLREIQRNISRLKGRWITPEIQQLRELCPDDSSFEILQAYHERLEYYHALDYDDILIRVLHTISQDPLPARLMARFQHLLVDEFQDVNAVQYELIKKWAGAGVNLFVIGDPDQAIYGFRGADHRFFGKLEEDFHGVKKIRLDVNYRSTPQILRAASAVIKHNQDHAIESLLSTRNDGPNIRYLELPGEVAEGIAVARAISAAVGGTTMLEAHGQGGSLGRSRKNPSDPEVERSFSDFAILVRTNGQMSVLERCLLQQGIPFRVVGREDYLNSDIIRWMLSFLRCVIDPDDEFHIARCLKLWPSLNDSCSGDETPQEYARSLRSGVYGVSSGSMPAPSGAERPEVDALRRMAARYQELSRSLAPHDLILQLADEVRHDQDQDVERLACLAARHSSLHTLVASICMGEEGDLERPFKINMMPESVTLMTIHASKGLEFPVVFVVGFEDGMIPLIRPGDHVGGGMCEGALEEERRLFYVAMTRAREELILLRAKKRQRFGELKETFISPFFSEIPGDLVEKEVPLDGHRHAPRRQLSLF
ncbi:MAG TPA: UvrD-helicase domain-containing protein [Firmicutes bacterium]|nr:UvrD-helicase domain-containing protein [Bacillota bacterium]